MSGALSPDERRALLALARAAIGERLFGDGSVDRVLAETDLTSSLLEPRGAFVSLKEKAVDPATGIRLLRGCIGSLTAEEALYRSVLRSAAQAAFEDPRFPPVEASELPSLLLEVSALTPLAPVPGPETIVLGRDGVVLEQGPFRALFLPQVAPEHGWETGDLLEHLAMKAGLPRDGWRGGRLSVFQAEVFGEEEP